MALRQLQEYPKTIKNPVKKTVLTQNFNAIKASSFKARSEFSKKLGIYESKGKVSGISSFSFTDNENEKTIRHPDSAWSLYKDVYERVPVAKNSIDHTADFGVQSGYQLEGPESSKKKIEDFIDKFNFDLIIIDILKQMQIYGNSYLELGKKGGKITSLKLLPPEQMHVVVVSGDKNDGELKGYKQVIKGGAESIDFSMDEIAHFKWNTATSPFYGVSDLKASIATITRLLNFQEDIGEIIHRYGNPIIHWLLGTEETPANADQVAAFKAMLDDRDTGEDVITSFGVAHNVISANLKITQPDGMLKHLENQLIAGLRVPEIFIRGGETSNKATADVEMQAFDRRVKSLRNAFARIAEDKIFKQIAPTSEVKIAWNEMSVETEATKADMLHKLVQATIPPKLALDMVGWGAWINEFEKEMKENPPLQIAPITQPTKPPTKQDVEPKKPEKKPEKKPKEEDFEIQADYIKALEQYKRTHKDI